MKEIVRFEKSEIKDEVKSAFSTWIEMRTRVYSKRQRQNKVKHQEGGIPTKPFQGLRQ